MKIGEKARHVGHTKMNDKSSRSHTIFRITLESTNRLSDDDSLGDIDEEGREVTISQLNLVDLAGSEKAAQTGAGGVRLKEGCNINQSLMVLGQVIQKLSTGDKGQHINFRDSKLTRILQNSIGGNAKTAIICTVTPAAMSEEQTVSTLRFASQAKTIQNHATVNEVLDDKAQINRLKKEMVQLQRELAEQKKSAATDVVAAMREQLEKERLEKEEHVRQIKELQDKVITSSQPAPSRNSKINFKGRCETWCAPALRANMRRSMAPHNFLKPLLPTGPVCAMQNSLVRSNSDDFTIMSQSMVEKELMLIENEKLSESTDSIVEDEPSPGSVQYISSPRFLSPRSRKIDELLKLFEERDQE